MKLIVCPPCSDVISLRTDGMRYCTCGKSWGRYTDNLNAEIGGAAIPIGFANWAFINALKLRPDDGMGKTFEAFVIPKVCDTIKEGVPDPNKPRSVSRAG